MPKDICMKKEEDVINWAFMGTLNAENCHEVKDTCILTPLNSAAMEINEKVLF